MASYQKSWVLYERAKHVLAGGVSSEFRKYSYPHPLFFTEGRGSHLIDIDGNDYLDYTLSQGPLILGHSHPEVLAAVQCSSATGQVFAGMHMQELELAETIQQIIPAAELLRFSLDGSEAVHTALRLARAATGRPQFLRFEGHYHGWLDNVAFGINGPSLAGLGSRERPTAHPWTQGLPTRVFDEALVLPWNDLALVERTLAKHADQIAAVITEPIMCNSGCILPEAGFLSGLRNLCDAYGVLLIFDEVITGFRLGLSGAQGYYGVTPDLAIFGKALANGYPISVLAGKRHFMNLIAEGVVIHAGTMNANLPTVAAAQATIKVLQREQVHQKLFALGERLMNGLRAVAEESNQPLRIQGPGPMFHTGFTTSSAVREYRDSLSYDKAKGSAFINALHERGIRVIGRGLWYLSAAHTEAEIDTTIEIVQQVLCSMA
jgi:glutamate-1-semialdehyde 2,1-aminomutase